MRHVCKWENARASRRSLLPCSVCLAIRFEISLTSPPDNYCDWAAGSMSLTLCCSAIPSWQTEWSGRQNAAPLLANRMLPCQRHGCWRTRLSVVVSACLFSFAGGTCRAPRRDGRRQWQAAASVAAHDTSDLSAFSSRCSTETCNHVGRVKL